MAHDPDHRRDTPTGDDIVVALDPRRLFGWSAAIALALIVVGVTVTMIYEHGNHEPSWMFNFFDHNGEANLPAWYSVLLLAGCAAGLALIARVSARTRDRSAAAWWFLALFLAAMSLDELAQVHEYVGGKLDEQVTVSHLGGYMWVIPGAIVGAVGFFVLLRAVMPLPRSTRRMIVVAMAIFAGGALGIEVVEALLTDEDADVSTGLIFATGVQELLEMIGAALFLRAVLVELARRSAQLRPDRSAPRAHAADAADAEPGHVPTVR